MKPTGDVKPRRDGWHEHEGIWDEVTVGTVIAAPNSRTQRWEIVEQAMATPVPPMKTLWMRAREMTTGAEFTSPPRTKTSKVIILTRDPADTTTPERTPPSDAEAIWLAVEELGATLLASIDSATGEVVCPDYIYESHLDGDAPIRRGLIEHMRFAHGMVVDDAVLLPDAITLHAQAHDPASGITRGGFPHRHVPEDLTLITGKRA